MSGYGPLRPIENRRVLGLDPGKTTGYCVVEVEGSDWTLTERGERTDGLLEFWHWLIVLKPDFIAIEKPFAGVGASTFDAIKLVGLAELYGQMHRRPCVAYYPATIRRVITGSGRSKDKDVAVAIRDMCGISKNPGKGKGLGQHQPAAIAAALTAVAEELGLSLEKGA